jgi:Lon-like ATP-dependent protease
MMARIIGSPCKPFGSLSLEAQKLLLTAIQDKTLPITGRQSGSSGTLIRSAPVPCDFVLVADGNAEDLQHITSALRSRILAYGFEVLTASSMPDTTQHRQDLWRFVAQEVIKDGRIPHFTADAVSAIIDQAQARAGCPGHLTTRLRELGGLVRIAGDLARQEGHGLVHAAEVRRSLLYAASIEEQQTMRQQAEALSRSRSELPARLMHNFSDPQRPIHS